MGRKSCRCNMSYEMEVAVSIPLHSIADRGLIRDLFDFDCWLAATQQPVSTPLMAGGERGTGTE